MKRMKKLLVFLLAIAMVAPVMAVPAKAAAAELTAKEILEKSEKSGADLTSCDETFSMEFGIKMKGMGNVNLTLDGTGTEFVTSAGGVQMPVKAKASVTMKLKSSGMIGTLLEGNGLKSGEYKSDAYVMQSATKGALDIYSNADAPGESSGWQKIYITQEEMEQLMAQYGATGSGTVPAISIADFADSFTVEDGGNVYILKGNIVPTAKLVKDVAKQSGLLKGMSKKEKKQFNKEVNRLLKKVKPMKMTLKVDKETFIPVEETVDIKNYFGSLIKAALKSDKKNKEMVKLSKQITITGCTMKVSVTNLNSAADFTLPEEASSAKEIPFGELMGTIPTGK